MGLLLSATVSVWLIVLPMREALAQSFDCGRARTIVEQMVCSDPDSYRGFGQIDKLMASLFQRRMREATSSESRELVLAQRRWLADRTTKCGLAGRKIEEIDREEWECLYEMYLRRVAELGHRPLKLLYGEDEPVCRKFHGALDAYHAKKPWTWSFKEALRELDADGTVKYPNWLYPEIAAEAMASGTSELILLDRAIHGDKKLIAVMHYNFLGITPTYSGMIWILKREVNPARALEIVKKFEETRDYQLLINSALAVFIPTKKTAFPHRNRTDLIEIGAGMERIHLNGRILSSPSLSTLFDAGQGCEACSSVADAITIDGDTYIFFSEFAFHGSIYGFGVLYRLTANMQAEVICITKGYSER